MLDVRLMYFIVKLEIIEKNLIKNNFEVISNYDSYSVILKISSDSLKASNSSIIYAFDFALNKNEVTVGVWNSHYLKQEASIVRTYKQDLVSLCSENILENIKNTEKSLQRLFETEKQNTLVE